MKMQGILKRISKKGSFNRDLGTIFGMIKTYKNWDEIFLDIIGVRKKKEMTIFLRNGIKFYTKDLRETRNIKLIGNPTWVRKSYTPIGFEIKKGDVVVDIGAHIGTFSIYAAYCGGVVYSYEPSDFVFGILKKNIKINNLEKSITPFKLSVFGDNKTNKIYISNDWEGQASMFNGWDKNLLTGEMNVITNVNITNVKTITLKEIIDNIGHIDFLKCDCEGSEYSIFLNTSKTVMNKINKISLEYHEFGQFKKESLLSFFESMGFDVILKPDSDNLGMIYANRNMKHRKGGI